MPFDHQVIGEKHEESEQARNNVREENVADLEILEIHQAEKIIGIRGRKLGQCDQEENVEQEVDRYVPDFNRGVKQRPLVGAQFRKRDNHKRVEHQDPDRIGDVLHVDFGPGGQRIPEQQSDPEKSQRSPENRNHRRFYDIFLIGFFVVKPKERGLHTIGQDHVEENNVRKNDGDFAVSGFGQQIGVERYKEKTDHPRKYRCESVDGGLLEKFLVNAQCCGFYIPTKITISLQCASMRFQIYIGYICVNQNPMKKILFLLLIAVPCWAQTAVITKKTPEKITRFSQSFTDDYSWLEKYNAAEVKDWVSAQNQTTESHLETVKAKYSPAAKLREYDQLSSNPLPVKKGRYFYGMYRVDKSRPAALYFRKGVADPPIEIVNPYKVFKDEHALIMSYTPSANSKYLAYKVSANGGDLHEIRFADMDKIKDLDDVVTGVKFSNVAWNGDKGIFYKKTMNKEVFARDSTYQLFYHKIGKPQTEDELVFDASQAESSLSFFTRANQLFIIEENKAETMRNYYSTPIDTETFILDKFIANDTTDFKFLHYANHRIYFSSKDYDWGDVRSFDIKNRSDEKVVIPQLYNHLLVNTDFYDKYILCKYKLTGKYYLGVYDREGNFIRKFDAPPGMDFTIRFYDRETQCLYVSFYSYTLSFHNFKLNLATGDFSPFYTNASPPKTTLFPLDYFETKTITYKSRDGKDIPITIVHKKGITLDGSNPTLLKAYGGFGAVSGPSFDSGLLYFLEKGGVFAYAEIRGGGEKGLSWHREGKGLKKINTFNDFIDAAEFLIREKYTSPQKLAITGTSQGGLLVGVAMTQRPELFKVAVPKMGAYDMFKFENYTIGKYHLDEYGNINTKSGFESIMGYSPYHNIKEEVNYPTTLIITSENDDRVPPIHSYKFAARLQNRAAQKNPVLLKTLDHSGHYGKVSTYRSRIEENAEFYAFLLFHLNN